MDVNQYIATATCINCKHVTVLTLTKGTPVSSCVCPSCGCRSLVASKPASEGNGTGGNGKALLFD